jgi:hypothetical protein
VVGALAALGLLAGVFTTATVGGIGTTPPQAGATAGPIGLELLGRYVSGNPDGGSEITAYDAATKRIFITNGVTEKVDIVDIADPTAPTKIGAIDVGRPIQSVAVKNGLVAVAAEGTTRQAPGRVYVADTDGAGLWDVEVGALPDMVTFTPDGTKILTANEGEPLNYCSAGLANDPEGSISIVDVASRTVATAGFGAYTDAAALRAQGIRVYAPNATPAQDLEPEYIAITPDGSTAFVTLQENNALAKVDIASATVVELLPLGYQAFSSVKIDASDRDGSTASPDTPAINIKTRSTNLLGMFMPDTIDAFTVGSTTYLALANEGDGREYPCLMGGTNPAVLERDDPRPESSGANSLAAGSFTDAERGALFGTRGPDNLRRLRVSSVFPSEKNGTGQITKAYTFGTRSFTIRNLDGSIVWDSGSELEERTALLLPSRFNGEWDTTTGLPTGFDTRSGNKGPEPEAVEVGTAYGRHFAFVGLERIGGVMVYDVTNPAAPAFVQYVNTSNFSGNYKTGAATAAAGDVSPEGIQFVPAADSPTGKPLVIVSYELSGTTAIFQLNGPPTISAPADTTVSEAAVTVELTVTLGEASSETVTVDYALVGETATIPDDVDAASGTLTFDPGETSKHVTVTVVDDTADEPDETFRLELSNPVKGLLDRSAAVVTVRDDDLPELRIADASAVEGDKKKTTMALPVTLSSPAATTVELTVKTRDGSATRSDYAPDTTKVRIEPGQTTATVFVEIKGDKKAEPDETFTVELTLKKGGVAAVQPIDLTAIATILDDD